MGRLPRSEMAAGAVFGLAWASAMRAMMAELAARDPGGSHFSIATFIFILLPGAVMGALMAWAVSPPRPGVRPAPQRLTWAPMVMCLDPAALPIMLAVVGAGWVAGGRGTPRSRLWIGIPSCLVLVALPVAIAVVPPPVWASLRNGWILTLATSLLGAQVIVETMVVRRLALTATPGLPATPVLTATPVAVQSPETRAREEAGPDWSLTPVDSGRARASSGWRPRPVAPQNRRSS